MTRDPKHLLSLLPAIYAVRDAEQGHPLRALLGVIGEQVDLVDEDIRRLYDNWFIETCDDWVVPYIGDLLGYIPVAAGQPGDPATAAGRRRNRVLAPRREVANTIAYRRRKGTLALLELVARDTAGWSARAVEFSRLLAWAQHLNLQHPARGGTLDLRGGEVLDLVGSPFDRVAHTVDVRRPGSARTRGLHNLPSVGLYVWRIGAYSVTQAPAYCREQDGEGCFTFSVLGNDAPLFTRLEPEAEPTHIAGEINLPAPIRRRALDQRREVYYGPPLSLHVWRAREGDEAPSPENAVRPDQLVVADLGGWYYEPAEGTVVVDPVRGRIAFPRGELPEGDVWVSYHYGFSAEMGGGEYRRELSEAATARVYRVVQQSGGQPLRDALARWRHERDAEGLRYGVIEIADSGFYGEPLDLDLQEGESLQIRAASGRRPVLNLLDQRPSRTDPLAVRGARGSRLTLDGLLITGRGIHLQGDLDCVVIRHSTLVPGWELEADCTPCHPSKPSITTRGFRGRLVIEHSIVGAIHVNEDEVRQDPIDLRVSDSILDATSSGRSVLATPRGRRAHAILTVTRSTLIGQLLIHAIERGENSIFLGRADVARSQRGCIRFSWVPKDSRTPRRFHCQPDLAITTAAPGAEGLAQPEQSSRRSPVSATATRVTRNWLTPVRSRSAPEPTTSRRWVPFTICFSRSGRRCCAPAWPSSSPPATTPA